MSDVPDEFTADYYNADYFATPKGKKFQRPDGSVEGWSYDNPTGEFLGARDIAQAWKKIFNPKAMLDVGAGRGTFIAYARDAGIDAEGFDYSPWAVNEGRYARCRPEWLRCHDAVQPWPYLDGQFDLVTALDFYEHIYEPDLPTVINEMYRVASRWVFLQIAVAGSGGLQGQRWEGYTLRKSEEVSIELEGCAVAGHVTVKQEPYWLDRLERDDWIFRRDMVNWFCGLVDPAIIKNWLLNSIIVLERI